jgi:hypothetical protein
MKIQFYFGRILRGIYYFLKPLISRKNQLYVRTKHVNFQRNLYKDIWPILTGSEKKPQNWKGWKDEKKFAFVLTHDVEHKRGYDRVDKLMQMEKELGFVSSFYFIPERDYKVENQLLDKIRLNKFEYGVHGLYHDGKLFQSKKIFLERAKKINQYLKEWKSVGFRAPAVHHNLDWIRELDIEYDLSTFDSDPFQPQSDGIGTIFPFWVNGKHGRSGYVEIPYTLDQDFTLFILMQETTPEIWIKKLDWIVENGGMAMVIVHPDYINFENETTLEEFPIRYYQDFLKYVKSKYEGKYWNALPREIADYFSNKTHGLVRK